jgi:hypothetical protein
VHPNIPGVDDGVVGIFVSRLGYMVMTLVVPEVTITWAAWQFLSAWRVTKDFNHAFSAKCAHDWDSELAVILLGDIPSRSPRAGQSHNQFKQEETSMKLTP